MLTECTGKIQKEDNANQTNNNETETSDEKHQKPYKETSNEKEEIQNDAQNQESHEQL